MYGGGELWGVGPALLPHVSSSPPMHYLDKCHGTVYYDLSVFLGPLRAATPTYVEPRIIM